MKKAVLFDLDGVLLTSMPFHVKAWQEVFADYGVPVAAQEVYSREGTRTADLARTLAFAHGLKLSEQELSALIYRKSQRYNEITRAGLMPGAVKLVKELKRRRLLTAIVTGTFRENLLQVLPKDFLTLFDLIVAGDDVTNGKPHPEPYLMAADQLEVEPFECVVIENAALGVAAAKAAGMFCVGLTSTQSKKQLQEADKTVSDLHSLLDQIHEILN